MTLKPPFIIDAGPALNFLATGNQRLLSNAIGRQAVHAPEVVDEEVLRKSRKIHRFKGVGRRWNQMKPNWLIMLPDDASSPALVDAARALLPVPLRERQRDGDDLGETMVVLHAYAQAMRGETVFVIIDDRGGRELARRAQAELARAKSADTTAGSIQIVRTVHIIERRINTPDIPDQATLKALWAAIAPMDDGLRNITLEATGLPTSTKWHGPQRP